LSILPQKLPLPWKGGRSNLRNAGRKKALGKRSGKTIRGDVNVKETETKKLVSADEGRSFSSAKGDVTQAKRKRGSLRKDEKR